ncbi:MAG: hypothetical protein ACYS7M_06945 [Planctomycetota bacterium]
MGGEPNRNYVLAISEEPSCANALFYHVGCPGPDFNNPICHAVTTNASGSGSFTGFYPTTPGVHNLLINLVTSAVGLSDPRFREIGTADAIIEVPGEGVLLVVNDNIGISTNADFVVVTGKPAPSQSFATQCMADNGVNIIGENPGAHIVTVQPAAFPGGPNTVSIVDAASPEPIQPGTRLVNLAVINSCSEIPGTFNVYAGVVTTPSSTQTALLTAPSDVAIDIDDEAVVKGNANDDGNASIVVPRQGGPALNTEVWSDLPLLTGDRIVNFLELWDDPSTGHTFYLADVEW